MLSACSGGSATSAANTSAPSPGSAARSGSTSNAGSSSSTGSTSSTGSAPAAVSAAGLTGNFCTDFTHLGQALSNLAPPKNQGDLAADQAYARQIITKAEGLFNGLATEAPPNVAGALHNITAQEQAVLGEMSTFGSLTQIKAQEHKLTTDPAYLASIRVLVQYMATKCG
jgi:hypothetical protein